MTIVDNAVAAYTRRFGTAPTAAAVAPGRVEIMGNHTDYNGGFVLPAALDKITVLAGAATGDDTITIFASDFRRSASFSARNLVADPQNSWASYVIGVVDQLQRDGVKIGGFQAVIHSDVPGGAGLSSSAALEVATAFFLQQLFPFDRTPMQIARLCQKAENEFVGVQCGILDQFSSVFGVQDGLLFLDCMTLEHSAVKMGRDDIAIVICDSNVKHALTGGDYNTRRAECMAAAAHFGMKLLREVPWDEFEARKSELPENQRKRAEHVLNEDKRVLAMRDAAQKGDTTQMGRLLAEGHASCRDLFENTSPELDMLVEMAVQIPGCIGAKMTGGGWGGCTVNLVYAEAVTEFCQTLAAEYKEQTGTIPLVYACRAAQGARVVKI
ncbi:MAG: galactokinase [Janthinobacterium lividum]